MNLLLHIRSLLPLLIGFALLASLAACSSDNGDDRTSERNAEAQEEARDSNGNGSVRGAVGAVRQLGRALDQARSGEGGAAESVDFRELRDLLPTDAPGMERTDAGGERQSMGGFSISQAKAEFRGDDGSMEVKIVDGGGFGALTMLGAAWMMTEMDRESSSGFERTTRFRGYPAYEKLEMRGNRQRSELQFVVADRFFVTLNGNNVDVDALHRVANDIDVRQLEGMKDVGRQAGD